MGVIELQGVRNVRDLGGTPVADGFKVRKGLLYRGSALNAPTEQDIDVLFNQLGIRCVIDLRSSFEREAEPDVEIPGVRNIWIPLFDLDTAGVDVGTLMSGVEAADVAAAAADSGQDAREVRVDVEQKLADVYRLLADPEVVAQLRKALTAAFTFACRGQAVYLHCTAGKDRAGVLAACLLAALKADDEAIVADYLLTNEVREADMQAVRNRYAHLVADEELLDQIIEAYRARPEHLKIFADEVDRRYGSRDAFIRTQLGIDGEVRERIHMCCVVPGTPRCPAYSEDVLC